jgi:hypothetical protein
MHRKYFLFDGLPQPTKQVFIGQLSKIARAFTSNAGEKRIK